MPEKFDLIVRAVILDKDKILLCRKKEEDYYFFPGGHIEFAEKAELAIARELLEEIGTQPGKVNYIGTVENLILEADKKIHEINLVFEAKILEKEIKSAEDHLNFYWIEVAKLKQEKILPGALKEGVIKWIKDRRCFWGSQNL
ncbi:NUDIX domain-containing protein [Patescibacteria group bacterium]|nr:NUDIX domain-containing protein [Patescibacteria group bacterium]